MTRPNFGEIGSSVGINKSSAHIFVYFTPKYVYLNISIFILFVDWLLKRPLFIRFCLPNNTQFLIFLNFISEYLNMVNIDKHYNRKIQSCSVGYNNLKLIIIIRFLHFLYIYPFYGKLSFSRVKAVYTGCHVTNGTQPNRMLLTLK